MELAEMENETKAADDVFVLRSLPLSTWLSPLFLEVVCHFQTLLPFSQCLSHSVCHTLSLSPSLSHTYKHRDLSLAYRELLLLWSKAFIWWLGLKNGHLLLPLINRVWARRVDSRWESDTQIKAAACILGNVCVCTWGEQAFKTRRKGTRSGHKAATSVGALIDFRNTLRRRDKGRTRAQWAFQVGVLDANRETSSACWLVAWLLNRVGVS